MGFAECLPAPEVAWSLIDAGFRVIAFSRRGAKPLLRHCRGVELVPIESPEVDARAALHDLERAITTSGASVFLPLDDAMLWMCRELDLRDGGTVVPTHEQARLALDKRLQIEQAHAAGFAVPPTQVGEASALRDALALPFPVIVRPANALEERGGRLIRMHASICADGAEFAHALERFEDRSLTLIVQPWLNGVSEGLFGLSSDGSVDAWSAHRRIRMVDPHGSGSSACVSTAVPTDLVEPARRFLERADWMGMFMFELLRDRDGVPWFVELNGRAWGSMALARRIGFEYPAWAARKALDPERRIEPPPIREGVVCRHLGLELAHAVAVLRGPHSRALQWPSRWRTIRSFLTFRRGETWYNLRAGERIVFVEETAAVIGDLVLRFARRLQRVLSPSPG